MSLHFLTSPNFLTWCTRLFDFTDLIAISRFAGERFDLVQAGGGNTSVKLDNGHLYVKASGMALADVAKKEDFCCIKWQPLLEFLNQCDSNADIFALENSAMRIVKENTLASSARPSIETLMHCALGHFTLHTHPIAVNAITCRVDWKEELADLFKDAFLIDYKTPGAALAVSLQQQLRQRNWQPGNPALVFLQNHGLIVAGNSKNEIMQLTNKVVGQLAQSLPFDLRKYQLVNVVSQLINRVCGTQWIAYLSDDQILNQAVNDNSSFLLAHPATPDQVVYCGPAGLFLTGVKIDADRKAVDNYFHEFKQPPKVVIMENDGSRHIILLGQSLHKCKAAEDVLRSHVLLQQGGQAATMQFLSKSEVNYLTNWEAEKYRMQ